jgi:hypothetical protein
VEVCYSTLLVFHPGWELDVPTFGTHRTTSVVIISRWRWSKRETNPTANTGAGGVGGGGAGSKFTSSGAATNPGTVIHWWRWWRRYLWTIRDQLQELAVRESLL